MSLFLGAMTIGLILSILALGVYLSFRVFKFPDITAEGSVTFGAAVSAVLLIKGFNPGVSLLAAFIAGAVAGAITGILHTKCKVNELLAGILVMTALYSVNLHVMGKSNIPLVDAKSTSTVAESIGAKVFGQTTDLNWIGWDVSIRDAGMLISMFAVVIAAAGILLLFFKTSLGTAIRATGDNPQMIRALGVDVDIMMILGLAISNGLIALAGALLAQYQGFADVQMGIGMMVWGLASVIIGEALVGSNKQGLVVTGTIMGSVLFRLLVAIALRWGLNPNDLKLITALFVFAALVGPTAARTLVRKNTLQTNGSTV